MQILFGCDCFEDISELTYLFVLYSRLAIANAWPVSKYCSLSAEMINSGRDSQIKDLINCKE